MKELGKKSLNGNISICQDCTKTKNGFRVCSGNCEITSKHKRIEVSLTKEEVSALEKIAKSENRSRKNLCEVYLRKMIKEYKLEKI